MGKERRVQPRTKAEIPLEIDGTDENGESFKEAVTTLELSRRGTSFLTGRSYGEESQVSVTIPGRGPFRPHQGPTDFVARAVVVRVSRLKEEDRNRVSLRFLGSTFPTYTSEKT